IVSALHGDLLRSLGAVLLQCFYYAIILGLLNIRLRAQYQGDKLSEAVALTAKPAARGAAPTVGWNIPGVPGPISAVVEKEFHYLSRSGPMLFTFIMPVVV